MPSSPKTSFPVAAGPVRFSAHVPADGPFSQLYEQYCEKVVATCLSLLPPTGDTYLHQLMQLGCLHDESCYQQWVYSVFYSHYTEQLRLRHNRDEQPLPAGLSLLMLPLPELEWRLAAYQADTSIQRITRQYGLSETVVRLRLGRAAERIQTLRTRAEHLNQLLSSTNTTAP